MHRALPLLLAAVIGLTACRTANIVHPFEGPAPAVEATDIDADAVILLDERHVELLDPSDPGDGYRVTEHLRVLVTGPRGLRWSRGEVVVPGNGRLVSVRGRSWPRADPTKVAALKPYAVAYKEFIDSASMLYSSNAVARFDVPHVQVGDVFEYETVIEVRGSASIGPWIFEGPVATRQSRLSVDVPTGQPLHAVITHAGEVIDLPAEVTPIDGGERRTWRLADLPPVDDARVRHRAWIAWASEYPDWDAVGSWYRELSRGLDELDDGEVPQISLAGVDPRQAWFRYVRDHVRYLAYYGESIDGFRPHPADVVLEGRFGDCKDMVTLLIALYRRAGIEAFPALISVSQAPVFPKAAPSPAVFDHVIVALPKAEGGYVFADPTAKFGTFLEIGERIAGRPALVVTPTKSELIEIPMPPARQNRAVVQWKLRPGGHATLTAELTGEEAARFKELHRQWGGDALPAGVRHRFLGRWSGAAVASSTVTVGEYTVRVAADIREPGGAWSAASLIVVPLSRFFDVRPDRPKVPGQIETTLELDLDRGREVAHLPASTKGERDEVVAKLQDRTVRIVHRRERGAGDSERIGPRIAREALVLREAGGPR